MPPAVTAVNPAPAGSKASSQPSPYGVRAPQHEATHPRGARRCTSRPLQTATNSVSIGVKLTALVDRPSPTRRGCRRCATRRCGTIPAATDDEVVSRRRVPETCPRESSSPGREAARRCAEPRCARLRPRSAANPVPVGVLGHLAVGVVAPRRKAAVGAKGDEVVSSPTAATKSWPTGAPDTWPDQSLPQTTIRPRGGAVRARSRSARRGARIDRTARVRSTSSVRA